MSPCTKANRPPPPHTSNAHAETINVSIDKVLPLCWFRSICVHTYQHKKIVQTVQVCSQSNRIENPWRHFIDIWQPFDMLVFDLWKWMSKYHTHIKWNEHKNSHQMNESRAQLWHGRRVFATIYKRKIIVLCIQFHCRFCSLVLLLPPSSPPPSSWIQERMQIVRGNSILSPIYQLVAVPHVAFAATADWFLSALADTLLDGFFGYYYYNIYIYI